MKWRDHYGVWHEDPEARWGDVSGVLVWLMIGAMALVLIGAALRAPAMFWGG